MASSSSFLSRISLGGNGGPLLPLHSSNYHSRRNSNDYDLSDLSPRPSSPLLSADEAHDFRYSPSSLRGGHGNTSRKGKGKSVAYTDEEPQFPPMSVMDRNRLYRDNRMASRERGRQSVIEQNPTADVDSTFRTIQRREHQIQKELQRLLDAQTAALGHSRASEPGFNSGGTSQAGSDTPRGTSRASSAAPSSTYRTGAGFSSSNSVITPAVIPVRQPKPKPLTIRQVRNSIARSMAVLADLKVEEDAYINSALSVRHAALNKANKLSKQHKAIAADLRALEKGGPLLKELDVMTDEYRKVCGDIELFEEKLKGLKHAKRQLEGRIEEVRSEHESGMSGYRGALRETERGIGEMMRSPGVKVLSVDGLSQFDVSMPEHAVPIEEQSSKDLLERRIGGNEFIRMRPERRTLGMAKDWWEGEIALLERRRQAVEREHAALGEGSIAWTHIVELIVSYEKRLQNALNGLFHPGGTIGTAFPKPERQRQEEEKLFRQQYRDLRLTIAELEKQLHHAEDKGWNLLVAAFSAELESFMEGEKILYSLMTAKGFDYVHEELVEDGLIDAWGDGRVHSEISAQEEQENEKTSQLDSKQEEENDLTGSVVRTWGRQTESSSPIPSSPLEEKKHQESDDKENNPNEPPRDLLGDNKEESDNEVPPGLLRETSVDDSDNDIPDEFLSMHEEPDSQTDDGNEVPADLLAEPEREHDDVD